MSFARIALFAAGLSLACNPATTIATQAVAAEPAALGAPAPAFTLTDTDGQTVSLADFKGKVVALEWFNPDCPFIVSAHKGGPLEAMPKAWTEKGVVWLTINSNAEGKQGHGKERNAKAKGEYDLPRAVLLDEDGSVGRAYGAKTTPHMYLVDPAGNLVYRGGLDNAPRGSAPKTGAVPFFENALSAVTAGEAVKTADTKAYGCSVKYGS